MKSKLTNPTNFQARIVRKQFEHFLCFSDVFVGYHIIHTLLLPISPFNKNVLCSISTKIYELHSRSDCMKEFSGFASRESSYVRICVVAEAIGCREELVKRR